MAKELCKENKLKMKYSRVIFSSNLQDLFLNYLLGHTNVRSNYIPQLSGKISHDCESICQMTSREIKEGMEEYHA